MSNISIATEVFAIIPDYEKRKIDIYKDAKASSDISGQMFYYTPLFSLVANEEGNPTVTVDEKKVEILFQCYTEQLHDVVLTEVRARLGSNELKSTQIGLIPLTQIEIEPESSGVASSLFPKDPGLSAISLDANHKASFEFSDEESAEKFAKRVEEKREDFYVKLTVPSAGTINDTIEISASDFKKIDWKNFVNDKNAEKNIDNENQYFTIDELSNSFSSILRRINITVVTENPDARQLTLDDKNKLLELFIQDLTKSVVQDLYNFPPPGVTEIFINNGSFNPDVIEKERIATSEAMTSAFESLIDTAQEDIKGGTEWSNRKSLLEQLDKAYRNKKGDGSFAAGVNVLKVVGVSSKGTAGFDFTDDTLKTMRQESEATDFSQFSSETRNKMKSELKNLLQEHSNFEWDFEGEKIIPKKIKLSRIISGEFKAEHKLLQTTRTIVRLVTRIGFAINSNINLINLENKMQKELDALKAEIESLKGQLSSKADNSALQTVENNLSNTIGTVQSTANDAVSRADNAQSTADDAVNRANNAQNTANDAVNRVQQLEAKTHAISRASDGGTWISAGDQYTLAIQVDGNIVRYKNGTPEAKSLLD
ncbi:alanine-zipper protein [Funiculus sociatus]|uniref:alanine-zipper protein n=1 Tax=Funiculus sociatus TaxID=450527 RepID=UPI003296C0B9